MRIKNFCIVIPILLLTASIRADTEQPQILLGPRAKMLKVGPKMDARGTDLEGTVIVGQDLTGARFDNAKLRGARISDCDLFNASFQGADLRGSTLTDCRIAGADFTDALINGIIGANHRVGRDTLEFTQEQIETTASFQKKDLSDCYVVNYSDVGFFDLRDFDLRGSSLRGDFSRSKFARARIRKVRFAGTFPLDELRKTQDFKSGDVTGEFWCKSLDLSEIKLWNSTVNVNDRSGFVLKGATLYDCRVYFRGSSASFVLPETKSYKDGTLAHNTFLHSDMSGLNFDRMNLTSCTFDTCNLADTTFNDAVVSRANFRDATGLTMNQIRSTWNFKNDRMSDVLLPKGFKVFAKPN